MIRIFHTSDLHGHGGIATRLRALRDATPGLLVDCGDSLRGSQTVFRRREPIIAEIDRAGYDVQAMGNREFHYLYSCVRARAAQMRHPLLCSNLVNLRGRPLPFERAVVIPYGGTRVHFLGLLVRQYPIGSVWERVLGWRFLQPVDVIREYVGRVADGELLVLLSHLGLREDRRLAADVARVDLILGGHSHDTLHEPKIVAGIPIVHAGPYGAFVSRSELEFDAQRGRFVLTHFELVPLLSA